MMEFDEQMQKIFLSKGESFIDVIQKQIQSLSETLGAKEDMLPQLFIKNGDQVTVCIFDPDFLRDGKSKDKFFYSVIPLMILDLKADAFAFASAAWSLQVDMNNMSEEEKRETRKRPPVPSQSKDRVEVVMLVAGDAERQDMYMAEIKRNNQLPPVVEAFKCSTAGDQSGQQIGGRTYAALQKAIEFNRNPTQELGTLLLRNSIMSDFGIMELAVER